MPTRSTPKRLDEAVDRLLTGAEPPADADLQPMLDMASLLADALRPVPVGVRFEARLADRLAGAGALRRAARELARPRRLAAAGALSSAALGLTVTAYAVWRSSRRQPALSQRLLHR